MVWALFQKTTTFIVESLFFVIPLVNYLDISTCVLFQKTITFIAKQMSYVLRPVNFLDISVCALLYRGTNVVQCKTQKSSKYPEVK